MDIKPANPNIKIYGTPRTKALRKLIEKDPRIVMVSIEPDMVWIYTDSEKWSRSHEMTGSFNGSSETAAVKDYLDNVTRTPSELDEASYPHPRGSKQFFNDSGMWMETRDSMDEKDKAFVDDLLNMVGLAEIDRDGYLFDYDGVRVFILPIIDVSVRDRPERFGGFMFVRKDGPKETYDKFKNEIEELKAKYELPDDYIEYGDLDIVRPGFIRGK